ncbi:MAG: hypothetical protein ACPGQC_13345 [Limisphaerales bacterium]
MKYLLIIILIAFSPLTILAHNSSNPSTNQKLAAEKGTAIGVGKSTAQARLKARQNIPSGARQTGAVKTVTNGDGTYTVYINWVKR